MNYNELISRFEVFENPAPKKGFERHHIVPVSQQIETDNRCIYVTPAQHMWLHILYDREHGTKTATRFLHTCGKPMEFFTCYELCLAYSYTLRKKKEEVNKKLAEVKMTPEYRQKMSLSVSGEKNGMYGKYGSHRTEETKQKMADAKKGKPNCNRGRKWFNDGAKNVMAYECPEGYVPGRLKRRIA